jgi:hypothetical protein
MGIRFRCQACSNKVNVKDFLAGKRGICPKCGARFTIPEQSDSEFLAAPEEPEPAAAPTSPAAAPATTNPSIVVSAPQQPAGNLPVAAPIAAATSAGHSPLTTTAQTYASPQFPATQFAPQQQPAAPYQPTMPTPGFHAAPVPAGPRDPFQEAPAAQWYVRHASGQQYGPAPAPTMQKWLAEGRVPGDGMVWREGWADWQVASLIFPQLAARMMSPSRGPMSGPSHSPPGMYPAPAQAPAAANNPFDFDPSPTSGSIRGNANAAELASQIINQRRDNSKMLLIISILLLFAIAAVGGVLWYVMTKPKEGEGGEEVVRHQRLSPPTMTAGILS